MSYAVVTGASRGIGRAIAHALADRGIDAALLARDEKGLSEVERELRAKGTDPLVAPCDLASETSIANAATRCLEKKGTPRILVHNGGIVVRNLIGETSTRDFDRVIAVNVRAPFLLTRAFLPSMVASKVGRIVAIGSISGTMGTARMTAYCASKWALTGFMKALAEEVRGTGVQALSVLPGSVDTAMLEGSGFPAAMQPEDVARLVTFAALDAPDAMNGSVVEIFGP